MEGKKWGKGAGPVTCRKTLEVPRDWSVKKSLRSCTSLDEKSDRELERLICLFVGEVGV